MLYARFLLLLLVLGIVSIIEICWWFCCCHLIQAKLILFLSFLFECVSFSVLFFLSFLFFILIFVSRLHLIKMCNCTNEHFFGSFLSEQAKMVKWYNAVVLCVCLPRRCITSFNVTQLLSSEVKIAIENSSDVWCSVQYETNCWNLMWVEF